MKIVWTDVTRNCWILKLPGDVNLAVNRRRSWKKLPDDKPFKVTVFGNPWASREEGYETLADAQRGAEQIAKRIVRGLAKWAAK